MRLPESPSSYDQGPHRTDHYARYTVLGRALLPGSGARIRLPFITVAPGKVTNMASAGAILRNLFRQAWVTLVLSLVMIGMLAVLAQVLRMTSASVIGARLWVQESIGSIAGIILLILFAFLAVPSIVQAGAGAVSGGGSCGPIAELGGFA